VKYADDLVLMAKEETLLQGMIDKLPYFSIDNAHLMCNMHPKLMYTAVYHACSFFSNLFLFYIDNACVIYRKIR